MGFFDDLFFGSGSSKPRITKPELKKVAGELMNDGFSQIQRNKVKAIFEPDLYETPTATHPRGLEGPEVRARMEWLRKNKSKHNFSDHQIDQIEEAFKKRL